MYPPYFPPCLFILAAMFLACEWANLPEGARSEGGSSSGVLLLLTLVEITEAIFLVPMMSSPPSWPSWYLFCDLCTSCLLSRNSTGHWVAFRYFQLTLHTLKTCSPKAKLSQELELEINSSFYSIAVISFPFSLYHFLLLMKSLLQLPLEHLLTNSSRASLS